MALPEFDDVFAAGTPELPRGGSEPRPRSPHRASLFLQGARFGRYEIVRLIGRGGMSEVYEAVHLGLRKSVALKVIRAELAEDEDARQRFVAEAENAAKVQHPHVVDVTDVGVHEGLLFLVMTLLDGEDLSTVYARSGPLPVSTLVDLLLPIALAVAAGHARGIVHRDLKPENIFLHRDGLRIVPKLLDFGVSLSMNRGGRAAGSPILGTPRYMSPEQALGQRTVDARTDQYSFGIILYEGVTGTPLRGPNLSSGSLRARVKAPIEPASFYVELPNGFEALLQRALEPDPADRFSTMKQLAAALLPYASGGFRALWSGELELLRERTPSADLTLPPRTSHVSLRGSSTEGVSTVDPAPPAKPPSGENIASEPTEIFPPARRPFGARFVRATATVTVPVALLAAGWWMTRSREPKDATRQASIGFEVRAIPNTAALFLDGVRVATGSYRGVLPSDGKRHTLRIAAEGYASHVLFLQNEPPPRLIALVPSPPSAAEPSAALDAKASDEAARPARATARAAIPRRVPVKKPLPVRERPAEQTLAVSASAAEPSGVAARPVDPSPAQPRRPNVRIIEESAPRVRLVD